MAVYRVWRRDSADSYWLFAASEADAIRAVSLTTGIEAAELKATPARGKHGVPPGVILESSGKTRSILRR